jgi:hypothetical protein
VIGCFSLEKNNMMGMAESSDSSAIEAYVKWSAALADSR